ncbi:MAG: hypothetical protein AAF321_10745, partial [Pseudomonadota bacterium]
RGHDAGQVAMMTSFGSYELKRFQVWTEELDDGLPDEALHGMLKTRPDSAALVTSGNAAA